MPSDFHADTRYGTSIQGFAVAFSITAGIVPEPLISVYACGVRQAVMGAIQYHARYHDGQPLKE